MISISKNKEIIPGWLMLLLAVACGFIVANLYYAQPLVNPISLSTGISPDASGLIVTFTQIGYIIGLLFLVPLSDLMENRRLISFVLVVAVIGLISASFSKSAITFFIAALLIGLGSVAAQILVPYASHLASKEERGRVVGNVMSGLLLGIMFARPVSSLIAGLFQWETIFILSSIITVLLILILNIFLPKRKPMASHSYLNILKSLPVLFAKTPILRRRSLYQACLFGSFSLFWTVVPLWLLKHFHLNQKEIALFALVGVGGAIAAPIAGRLADKGLTKRLTGIALLTASISFGLTHIQSNNPTISILIFCVSAILLDMSVSGNLVLGQQALYSLQDEIRGRINGIFMAVFFAGGAIGSSLGGWAYANGEWRLASIIGLILPLIAFLYSLTEEK